MLAWRLRATSLPWRNQALPPPLSASYGLICSGYLIPSGIYLGHGAIGHPPQLADNVLGTIMDTPFFPEDVLQHVYLRAEPSGGGVSPSSTLACGSEVLFSGVRASGWTDDCSIITISSHLKFPCLLYVFAAVA